jgi:hypothetical protein
MAADFADGFGVIVHAPEVVTARHRGEGAVEREDFEAVAGQIEFPDDFRTEKRNDVRALGEQEAGDDFFRDGGTAENVATFKDEDLFAGFGEIRGVDQTVVTAADDDDVVVLRHRYDSGIKKTALNNDKAKCKRAIVLRESELHKLDGRGLGD